MPAVSIPFSSRVTPPEASSLEATLATLVRPHPRASDAVSPPAPDQLVALPTAAARTGANQASDHATQAPAQLNGSNPTAHGLGPAGLPARYTADPRGSRAVREMLAEATGYTDPARTYLTSSTSQAYAWLFSLLADPGESVAAPVPGYPLLDSLARLTGVDPLPYRLAAEDGWRIDLPALETHLAEAATSGHPARAIVVVSPGNPTGTYCDQAAELGALADRWDLAIIADEVFYPFALTDQPPVPRVAQALGEDGPVCFTLDGLSKSLAAPHAKLGWIHVTGRAGEVSEAMARLDVLADDFLPVGAPQEMLAADLLIQMPAVQARVRARLRASLAAIHEVLGARPGCPVSALPVQGGWSVLLRMPASLDEDALALACAEQGLLIQPGYYFDMPFAGFVPVSLLPEPADTRRNLQILLEAVDRLLV